ncbi:MAG TPA: hypothetical protein PLT66_03505, partial [Bacillota bacterium]|nr:hypothetical protein [Bacillota bacterium]
MKRITAILLILLILLSSCTKIPDGLDSEVKVVSGGNTYKVESYNKLDGVSLFDRYYSIDTQQHTAFTAVSDGSVVVASYTVTDGSAKASYT